VSCFKTFLGKILINWCQRHTGNWREKIGMPEHRNFYQIGSKNEN